MNGQTQCLHAPAVAAFAAGKDPDAGHQAVVAQRCHALGVLGDQVS